MRAYLQHLWTCRKCLGLLRASKLQFAQQHFLQKKLADICPSIEIFVDHIEYVINKIGIDYVGIGSDYDGLDCLPNKWNDCLDHMIIQESLENRGYKNSEIEKIMGKNILRVLEEIHN